MIYIFVPRLHKLFAFWMRVTVSLRKVNFAPYLPLYMEISVRPSLPLEKILGAPLGITKAGGADAPHRPKPEALRVKPLATSIQKP